MTMMMMETNPETRFISLLSSIQGKDELHNPFSVEVDELVNAQAQITMFLEDSSNPSKTNDVIHSIQDLSTDLKLILCQRVWSNVQKKYEDRLWSALPSTSKFTNTSSKPSADRAEEVLGKASSVYAQFEDVVNLLGDPLKDSLRLVNSNALTAYKADFLQAIYRDMIQARSQSLTRDTMLALRLNNEWRSLVSEACHKIVQEKILSGNTFPFSSNANITQDSFADQSYDFDEQALPNLKVWLEGQIVPILHIWNVDHIDVLTKQIFYKLYLSLGQLRARQLFDIISDFPQSSPALQDLIECSEKVNLKTYVSDTLAEALQARLLHPGASTRDIIQFYTHLIRSLRFVDPSGVVLSHVIGPVRSYLRARNDTISVIVASLLGQAGDFTLLHHMMRESSALQSGLMRYGRGGGGANGDQSMTMYDETTEVLNNESFKVDINAMDESKRMVFIPEPDEEDWAPRPVDAGPYYRQSRKSDVIAIIVSIFDDEQGFIAAIERSCAEQIIQVRRYDTRKEYETNENLKKRFGDSSMGKCDVMLNDVKKSQRIDRKVHNIDSNIDSSAAESFKILHPLILSRQFWPLFNEDGSATTTPGGTIGAMHGGMARGGMNNTAGNTNEISMMFAFTPSATQDNDSKSQTNITPLKGTTISDNDQLPKQFKQALEEYQTQFPKLVHGRKLRWLPGRSLVHVNIQMNDGRTIDERVTPLQASIVQLAASNSTETEKSQLVLTKIAEELQVTVPAVEQAIQFWVNRRILTEITPGTFSVTE